MRIRFALPVLLTALIVFVVTATSLANAPKFFSQTIEVNGVSNAEAIGAIITVDWLGGGTLATVRHHRVGVVKIPIAVTEVTVHVYVPSVDYCGGPELHAVSPHHPGDQEIAITVSPCA